MLSIVPAVFGKTFQAPASVDIGVLENSDLLAMWQWGQRFCKPQAVFGTEWVSRLSVSAVPALGSTFRDAGVPVGLPGKKRGQAGGQTSTQISAPFSANCQG